MGILEQLSVDRLRNLSGVQIKPAPHINIVHGDNGSGKTSLLEAIHTLALGRSFRSNKLEPLIYHDADDCVIHARLAGGYQIGLHKTRRGTHILKFQNDKQRSWQEVAQYLPVQVLNAESFALLEGGARVRRRFLDWGVFHVEHGFVEEWRGAARCLAQRNLLLKQKGTSGSQAQLDAWDHELAAHAEKIHKYRERYFSVFYPVLETVVNELVPVQGLEFSYQPGWDTRESFLEVLQANRARDLRYGATQQGPHRADLSVKAGRLNAVEVLSRGQQKLLVSAMKIAQGRFLGQSSRYPAIYLVDDLAAELDRSNRVRVCDALVALETQLFFTCVEPGDLENLWDLGTSTGKFHVEHGKILLENSAD